MCFLSADVDVDMHLTQTEDDFQPIRLWSWETSTAGVLLIEDDECISRKERPFFVTSVFTPLSHSLGRSHTHTVHTFGCEIEIRAFARFLLSPLILCVKSFSFTLSDVQRRLSVNALY